MTASSFPDGFRWATATAAHQIEGGNWNSDWWRWEHTLGSGVAEPSGDACDSWHRWEDDADLVGEMGLGSYRFSVEWARIEPEMGHFSIAALDHYRRVCEGLRRRGIEPVVTLHHFTSPRWLADRGGWEHPETADRFARYAERVAAHLGDVMGRACTINEPNIVASIGWGYGAFPPGVHDWERVPAVQEVFVDAHRKGVEAIRAAAPGVPVGLTLSMTDYQAVDGGEEKMTHRRTAMEDVYLAATAGDDFVGVQTYTRERFGPQGRLPNEDGVTVLPMGYELWPDALEATVRRAWEVTGGEVPILVTENGIGTDDDRQRIEFLHGSLAGLLRAIDDGIEVLGYTCWSLLDNFEWAYGYRPHFGLVEVDRTTFQRTPKPSARWFGEVARANALVDIP
ncbi:MAG: family 1 glycosylhydrolase [Acidimicrobiia bacterium]|nr:family 1 glycosylhydrolase [Acidimicrobiia bacterium]